jgi:carbamoyl-phosphate synthase small subunit
MKLKPDGLVVSNGPGDPAELTGVVQTLRRVVEYGRLPTFGICLGHQVLALALGAKTFKLKYGHRGGNQPVAHVDTGEVIITAQNHGYAVDPASLPSDVEPTLINLNDGTNEGLRHRRLPIHSVQFHPEASPGPTDARHLFVDFVRTLERDK